MPTEVIMPKVDMDMTHGTFAVWHKSEGSEVKQGEPLFDIETEKAAMEVEAPASGWLRSVQAKPGDLIPVGSLIAWILRDGEAVPSAQATPAEPAPSYAAPSVQTAAPAIAQEAVAAPEASAEPEASPEPVAARSPAPATATSADVTERKRATPLARRIARQNGLSIGEVNGSGPRGRVQHSDVVEESLRRLEPEPSQVSLNWVSTGGELSWIERKGTGTPILLIHGFASDSTSWMPLEKSLPQDRTILRVDLPSHGKSPRWELGNFAELARMVIEAVDRRLGSAAAVHIVAHSLGGAAALALADIRPRNVRSMTLVAPGGLGPDINSESLNGIVRSNHADSLLPWLKTLAADPEIINQAYAKAAFAGRADPSLRAAQADAAKTLFRDGVQTFDLRPALARLQKPLQIVWGKQDNIIPYRHALSVRGDFGLHLLEGVGHIPQFESPERLGRIVHQFVAGVEATS